MFHKLSLLGLVKSCKIVMYDSLCNLKHIQNMATKTIIYCSSNRNSYYGTLAFKTPIHGNPHGKLLSQFIWIVEQDNSWLQSQPTHENSLRKDNTVTRYCDSHGGQYRLTYHSTSVLYFNGFLLVCALID